MKKTLIITLEYPPQIGGIASYVYNLAAHLPQESVVVCAPKIKGDQEFDEKNPWSTIRVKQMFLWFWPHWLKLFFVVRKIIKTENIEQVYINHILPTGYVGWLLTKMLKIPYVVFLHGSDLFFARKNWWKRMNFKLVGKLARTVVVNSDYMKHELENTIENLTDVRIVYPCPAEVFLQSPDQAKVAQIRSQLSLSGKRVVITVARLVDRKGHAILASVLSQIISRVPNTIWLIIGDGPEKDNVMKILQKNNLTGVVRFLSSVPLLDLPAYFYVSDLFVLLTHIDRDGVNEAWGQVLLEAAVTGLPVVAGNCGGVGEAVENGVTGFVIEASNSAVVVNTISDLLKNVGYAKQLGVAGKERVLREFTWAKQIQKLD